MTKIDFVPDDYVQQRESSRANMVCLILFAAIMGGIGATFTVIKMRQKAVRDDLTVLNQKMQNAQQQIAQLEQLTQKRKTMMKTAVMTAELIESVPKSVLLACVTNNLPSSVSLLELKVESKEVKPPAPAKKNKSQYEKASEAAAAEKEAVLQKPIILTSIELEGIAPSDIEVANYIAALTDSILLEKVGLIESKEYEIEGIKFRQFKLNAMLKQNIELTQKDIESIKNKSSETI